MGLITHIIITENRDKIRAAFKALAEFTEGKITVTIQHEHETEPIIEVFHPDGTVFKATR